MVRAEYTFPKGFLWGSVTSAQQVEGDSRNNTWWKWEKEGRAEATGAAAEWWRGRWREDIARAAEAGQNALRISIEWSRIQPSPERWDDAALERYRAIARFAAEKGIKLLITLHHFTDPIWFAEQGGWCNPKAPSLFAKFAVKAIEALRAFTDLWCTFNEPAYYIYQAYIADAFPPGEGYPHLALKAAKGIAYAHAAAYEAIHHVFPQARVGIAFRQTPITPKHAFMPTDLFAAARLNRLLNNYYPHALTKGNRLVPWLKHHAAKLPYALDWFGVSYYTPMHAQFDAKRPTWGKITPPDLEPRSEHGEIAHYPKGLHQVLKRASKFGLPILITANGIEDNADSLRPRYLAEHLHQVWRAVNCGYGVEGYFHYSLLDGYEWDKGWNRQFGLWALDRKTQSRSPRNSAKLYAEICHANMIDTDVVAQYAPDALQALLPVE